MKMTLSMPRTISRTVRVSRATHVSGFVEPVPCGSRVGPGAPAGVPEGHVRHVPSPRHADPQPARPRHRAAGGRARRAARCRSRPRTRASTEFRPEPRALPRVLRLDARLPDEPERLRGDGRAPARGRLRRGAVDGRRRPRRHQHLRDPRGGRGRRSSAGRASSTASRRANPGMRVVLTGCAVREPNRAGLERRYPAVDLFLRPDEEPELVDRLGSPRRRRPVRARRRRPRRRRSCTSAPRARTRAPRRGARGRAVAGGAVARGLGDSAPGCRSSTAATRRAPTASCRSAAARSAAARSTRSSTRRARWPPPATARSRCSARTSTRTATTCAAEARFAHVDTRALGRPPARPPTAGRTSRS